MKKTFLIIILCLLAINTFGQNRVTIITNNDTLVYNDDFDWEQWADEFENSMDSMCVSLDGTATTIHLNMENLEENLEKMAKNLEKTISKSVVFDEEYWENFSDNFADTNNYSNNVHIMNYGNWDKFDYEKKKEIRQNYTVNKDVLLNMIGKYSDFRISAWDKNEIDFRVVITTRANKESKAEELLNAINIDFSGTRSQVTAETLIETLDMRNCGFTMIYYVKVPRNVVMNLKNNYGDIKVGTVTTDFDVELKYGDIQADSLLGKSNFDIAYGDADVRYANRIDTDMKYGDLKAKNAKEIVGKLAYSDLKSDKIEMADLILRYSDMKVDKMNKLTVDGKYSDVVIDDLENELFGTFGYGDLLVRYVERDFKSINVNSNYGDVRLGLSSNNEFRYNLETRYGDLKCRTLDLEKNASQIVDKDNTEKLIGNYGKNPSANVTVKGNYLDIIIGQ